MSFAKQFKGVICSVILGIGLAIPTSASATSQTFIFEGVVTGTQGSLAAYFSGGETISGSFTYLTTYPDQYPLSQVAGVYGFPDDIVNKFVTAFSASIGANHIGVGTNSTLTVLADKGTGTYDHDQFSLLIHDPAHPSLPQCPGACNTEFFGISLSDYSRTALNSDAIPTSLNLAAFDQRE